MTYDYSAHMRAAADYMRKHGVDRHTDIATNGEASIAGALRMAAPDRGAAEVILAVLRMRGRGEDWGDLSAKDDILKMLHTSAIHDSDLSEAFGSHWRDVVTTVHQAGSVNPALARSVDDACIAYFRMRELDHVELIDLDQWQHSVWPDDRYDFYERTVEATNEAARASRRRYADLRHTDEGAGYSYAVYGSVIEAARSAAVALCLGRDIIDLPASDWFASDGSKYDAMIGPWRRIFPATREELRNHGNHHRGEDPPGMHGPQG